MDFSDPRPGEDRQPESERRIALDARDWIVRLTSGAVGEAELRRFKAWRDAAPAHRRAFEQERRFWQELQGLEGQVEIPRLDARAAARPGLTGRRRLLLGGGGVAVAAAAALALPRLGLGRRPDFETAVGQQAEVTLPDGTRVALNTDSALALDFGPGQRRVELLRGEALFEPAAAAAPFRVAALDGSSEAPGGGFAVRALGEAVTVLAVAGAVSVRSPARPEASPVAEVVLAPGEQTQYAAGAPPLPPLPVDLSVALAWRSGRVIFEGRPFASAIAELGRYVPERILLGEGVDRALPVSAVFSIQETHAALQALAKTQGLSLRRVPGVLFVLS